MTAWSFIIVSSAQRGQGKEKKMSSKFTILLLFTIALLFICSCATPGHDISAVNCMDQEYEGIKARVCASQSLIDRDLPRNKLYDLFEAEQVQNVKFIKSHYKLSDDSNENLTRRWNQVVKDLATFDTLSNLKTKAFTDSMHLDEDLLKLKRENPEIYNSFIQILRDFFRTMPTPVFQEIDGEIILQNDPVLQMLPYFSEKIFALYKTKEMSEEEEAKKREELRQGLKEIIPMLNSITKHLYPIQYNMLVIQLAERDIFTITSSIRKMVFIVSDPSFAGMMADHTGNLLISSRLLPKLDDNAIETLMIHEAVHLLTGNAKQTMRFLFNKNREKWKQIVTAVEGKLSRRDIDELDRGFDVLEDLILSFDTELAIDSMVLTYLKKQPRKRDLYARALSSFESISSERMTVIERLNDCINNNVDYHNYELTTLQENILYEESSASPSNQCILKLKNAVADFEKLWAGQIIDRASLKNADLFFDHVNGLLNGKGK